MTQEQIEAKALELYPVEMEWIEYRPGFPEEEDQNAKGRAAFIKGCQYAATAQQETVEGQQPFERYPELTESILWFANNVGVPLSQWTNHLQRINEAITAAVTPSSVSGLQWVKASERLPDPESTVVARDIDTLNHVDQWDIYKMDEDHLEAIEWLDEQK